MVWSEGYENTVIMKTEEEEENSMVKKNEEAERMDVIKVSVKEPLLEMRNGQSVTFMKAFY